MEIISSRTDQKWWKEATVYQVYPSSYCDSNGDGIGDIPGIISKLDYIKSLGVDVVWLSPHYRSPQFDLGYDISDYQDVHEPYGTLADADALIKGCHDRGMKFLCDLVINHTSYEHRWFKESRSSKDNPKRDWYMWRPAKYVDGKRMPPNNWRAAFGGSVWEWDELTQEYYLHYFEVEQPDLNWENPVTRKAIYEEAIIFWLERGCDGFRIDTVNMYSKHTHFPDAPITEPGAETQNAVEMMCNGPRLNEFIAEMTAETFSKYDVMTVGECPFVQNFRQMLPLVSESAKRLNMAFEFELAGLDHGGGHWILMPREWKLSQFKAITKECQNLADPEHCAWVTNYLENHDQARSISRFASDAPEHRITSSKMLATYLLTLSGTSYIYQGQEIGMINCPKSWSIEEEYKDCATTNAWEEIKTLSKERPEILEQARHGVQLVARDHARTPMHWTSGKQAGFTTSEKPWMRVMDSYVDINVESQIDDPDSPLSYYKQLIKIRKEHKDILVYGKFTLCDESNPNTITYIKRAHGAEGKEALVVLNFTPERQSFEVPKELKGTPKLAMGNFKGELTKDLRPYEGRLYFCE